MEIPESEVLSLVMVNIRQGHSVSRLGLIIFSLICYAVMLLHPFVAHQFESAQDSRTKISAISALVEKSEILSTFILDPMTNQVDCPICRQISENPVALFWIPPLGILLFLFSRQSLASIHQCCSKVFTHWLSRAPPSGFEWSNQ